MHDRLANLARLARRAGRGLDDLDAWLGGHVAAKVRMDLHLHPQPPPPRARACARARLLLFWQASHRALRCHREPPHLLRQRLGPSCLLRLRRGWRPPAQRFRAMRRLERARHARRQPRRHLGSHEALARRPLVLAQRRTHRGVARRHRRRVGRVQQRRARHPAQPLVHVRRELRLETRHHLHAQGQVCGTRRRGAARRAWSQRRLLAIVAASVARFPPGDLDTRGRASLSAASPLTPSAFGPCTARTVGSPEPKQRSPAATPSFCSAARRL